MMIFASRHPRSSFPSKIPGRAARGVEERGERGERGKVLRTLSRLETAREASLW
jgi:hypothetical protein